MGRKRKKIRDRETEIKATSKNVIPAKAGI